MFWIVTVLLAILVATLLATTLLRPRRLEEPPAAYDLRVYRDQLKEIDRDLARGVVDPADAERVRAEVSRRILAADAQMQSVREGDASSNRAALIMAAALVVCLVGGTVGLYQVLGAPGYGDLGLAERIEMAELARQTRPDQAAAEASFPAPVTDDAADPQYAELMDQLRQTVADRPDDLQGHMLLAQNEAALGRFAAAHAAQAQVIGLKGDSVSAQDYADLAEMMVLAAGGYVSPEAEVALATALDIEPRHPVARYYWGLMMAQIGRPDMAFQVWDGLLRDSRAGAPWVDPILSQIEDVAARAGRRFNPAVIPGSAPPAIPGPSAEDIEAAQDMSPEDRMAMIEGMVSGLAERLASEGGSADDWARLISALGVLGDLDRAQSIFDEAKTRFAEDPDGLGLIREAAARSGLAP